MQAEGTGEPAAGAAAPEETMDVRIAEAEKDFFDVIKKERKRLRRKSRHIAVRI